MKLLKGQSESVNFEGVQYDMKVVDTATQAGLLDHWHAYARTAGLAELAAAVRYVVTHCLNGDSIIVSGVTVSASDLLNRVDMNHPSNQEAMMRIVGGAIKASSVSEEEEKK